MLLDDDEELETPSDDAELWLERLVEELLDDVTL